MLDPLEALGYDRDHHRLADPDPIDSLPSPSRQSGTGRAAPVDAGQPRLTIDPELSSVTVPAGVRFDPGGIGKGLAADIVAQDLVDQGAWWVMVGLGGDLRFAGESIAAHGWTAVVEDPRDPAAELGHLRVDGGAVATSSQLRRRWSHDGRTHHHLLDPATHAPATSPVVAATVQASHGWLADVLAKCVVIAGPDRAEPWLDAAGAGAIVSSDDGSNRCIGPIALLEDAHVQ
jgi:thiamine biosynthesis lipoprotein